VGGKVAVGAPYHGTSGAVFIFDEKTGKHLFTLDQAANPNVKSFRLVRGYFAPSFDRSARPGPAHSPGPKQGPLLRMTSPLGEQAQSIQGA